MNWLDSLLFTRFSNRASGFVTNASGVLESDATMSTVLLSLLLGSFFGLLTGFIASNLFRGITGNHAAPLASSPRFALIGSVVGAVLFTALTLSNDEN